jgi:hypothetical protein
VTRVAFDIFHNLMILYNTVDGLALRVFPAIYLESETAWYILVGLEVKDQHWLLGIYIPEVVVRQVHQFHCVVIFKLSSRILKLSYKFMVNLV